MGHAATNQELKRALYPQRATTDFGMADFRFKGYVNDFMVSPRNPITLQSSHQMAGIMSQSQTNNGYQYPKPPKQPQTQSAELRSRKEESDRDIASFKQERLQEMLRMEQLKKQEYEQMQSYRPFGKAGAGAPNFQNQHNKQNPRKKERKMQRWAGVGVPPTDSEEEEEEDEENEGFRQHNVQPKPPQQYPQPPQINNHPVQQPVSRPPPPKPQPPKTEKPVPVKSGPPRFKKEEPGNSAVDRALTDTQKRIEQLKREMEQLEASNVNSIPYIDPIHGPPQRPTPPKPAMQERFDFFDPWGKGQGNPRRNDDGNLKGYPAIRESGIVPTMKEMQHSWPNNNPSSMDQNGRPSGGSAPIPIETVPGMKQEFLPTPPHVRFEAKAGLRNDNGTGLNTESKYGGSGEPVKTYSGSNRTRFPITMRKDIYGNSMQTEMDGYNPFKGKQPYNPDFFPYGKPGGGAPMTDNQGKFHLQRRNIDFAHEMDSSADLSKRRKAADEYLQTLKKEMAEQRRNREEANVEARAPIGEFASIVQQGKVGFPKRDPRTGTMLNHHHKTSDVTRLQNGIPDNKRFAGVVEGDMSSSFNAAQYHNDLSKIAEERHRMRQLEKIKDSQEEMKHGQTWNDMWGRPGAGAPNSNSDPNFRKPKFHNVLHHPENRNGLVFVKNTPHGIHQLYPEHYNKTTISSSHNNNFELPLDPVRRERNLNYNVKAPFATI